MIVLSGINKKKEHFYDNHLSCYMILLGSLLLRELKKLDDKNLLVEVQLLESKTYLAIGNLAKARAALTSARTTANSIYCPPKLQTSLDLQSGILHAVDEKDKFKGGGSFSLKTSCCGESIQLEGETQVVCCMKALGRDSSGLLSPLTAEVTVLLKSGGIAHIQVYKSQDEGI
ncbi:hypothetical protein CHUAL_009614 [Chamberlinius hualienensis]